MNKHIEQQLRHALAGHVVAVIGGDPRPGQIRRIESQLGFKEVVHCTTNRRDASSRRFAHVIHRSDIALVICARGLTRTQHGLDLHALCRRMGIPLLNCNHIPHPNSVLAGIVSARLTDVVLARCDEVRPNELNDAA